MKELCGHEPLIHCPDFTPDHSEFGIGESRYLACQYAMAAIEAHQAGRSVNWEDVKRVLRLALGEPEE
ncbi:MAG: hypothetical protein VR69_07050 [Peptococcaceae bacterium BRH_c4b]|nr:MAG: hypothetical protein VR69_07050 [Peptococcaceae bacterium BRH_c4b]